jgi:chaperonin cofactor prefoldin
MNQSLARAVQDLSNAADTLDKSSKILEKNVKALPNQRDFMSELKSLRSRLNIRD